VLKIASTLLLLLATSAAATAVARARLGAAFATDFALATCHMEKEREERRIEGN
jgi:hypothetical protein